jgi:hypothetical protein
MIIGGVAVIARGVARATRDVDATIAFDGDVDDLKRKVDAVGPRGLPCSLVFA